MVVPKRRPAELRIADEYHSRRPPIFDCVWKDVDIHEVTVGLAAKNLPQFAIRMPQADGGQSRIGPNAEKIELELEFDRAEIIIYRHIARNAESALLGGEG